MKRVLNKQSLAETLWRLEEVHLKFENAEKKSVSEALDWILARHGKEGSYGSRQGHGTFFAPTANDIREIRLPTGERLTSPAANRHILGEESLRALVLWKRKSAPETKHAINFLNRLLDIDETGMGKKMKSARDSGWFCCAQCTPAMLRTVNVVEPARWEKTLKQGILGIKKKRTSDGRWHRFPFYYTLLMLSEIDSKEAIQELRYARFACEKLLKRYEGKPDRTSQFRAHAINASLSA